MTTTPDRILRYLSRYQTATAGDLSSALTMTAANIRYHLSELVASGQICPISHRKPGGVGRPSVVFGLSPASKGAAFRELTEAICAVFEQHSSKEDLLEELVSILLEGFQPPAHSQITHYNQAVEHLNCLPYQAAWEARPGGPQVLLHHCPYLDLPLRTGLLCELDQQLISRLFNLPMILAQKRSPEVSPSSCCIFQVQPPGDLSSNEEYKSEHFP